MSKELVYVLPTEVKVLADKVKDSKKEEVSTVLNQIFVGTDEWEREVDAIDVKGVDDKESMELADVARKNAKDARVSAEKIFDAKRASVQQEKAEFDNEDKLWLKAKQVMQIKLKAIEDKAKWKADFAKRYEADQKEITTQKRIVEVSKYADINRIQFENMNDELFDIFLNGLKSTHEAKIEAERIAEEERVEWQKKVTLRNERELILLNIEGVKSTNNMMFTLENLENKDFSNIIDYSTILDATEDKFNSYLEEFKSTRDSNNEYLEKQRLENIQLKKEADEREELARIERKKLADAQAELKAKQDTEIKAENERKEKEQIAKLEYEKLAKAPIKKQLSVWIDSFNYGLQPIDNETTKSIIETFEKFKNWAQSQVDSI